MIVDCHSHVWPCLDCLGQARDFSCLASADLDSAHPDRHWADTDPADVTFVLGFVSRLLGAEIPNEFLEKYVAEHPRRLVAFAGLDPTHENCRDELHRIHDHQTAAGITLSPACQGFHPCDTRAMALYELADRFNLPVYFLQGVTLPPAALLKYAQPVELDEVAQNFPQLKIILSHLGYPWFEQTIALLAKHSNVYADVAGFADRPFQAYRTLNLAYECGVIEKLLFASDFPSHDVKTAAESLYNLNKLTRDWVLPAIPREQLRSIVERDSLSLLGLAHDPSGQKVASASPHSL